jgi:hypothetical protein
VILKLPVSQGAKQRIAGVDHIESYPSKNCGDHSGVASARENAGPKPTGYENK